MTICASTWRIVSMPTETAISTLLAPNGAVMPKMRVSMVGMVANTARNRALNSVRRPDTRER